LLDPGEYRIQLGVKHFGGELPAPVRVRVEGRQLSDPIGPPDIDPTETPLYGCEGLPELYCYTLDDISNYPYFWDPVLDTTLPTANDFPFDPPSDLWYWNTDLQSTNPDAPHDVNYDNFVVPNDALSIINNINAFGSGPVPPPPIPTPIDLDVTGDGFISPIDALNVINYLNSISRLTPPAGEGEASSNPAAPQDLATFLAAIPLASDGDSVNAAQSEIATLPSDQRQAANSAGEAAALTMAELARPSSASAAADRSPTDRSKNLSEDSDGHAGSRVRRTLRPHLQRLGQSHLHQE
jgi:Dockerin type I domain